MGGIAIALTLLTTGCGGTDATTNATTTTVAKPPPAHTTPAPVARLRRQLRAAGIGGVRILYADSDKTRGEGAEIVKIMHNHPRTGLVYVHGQLVAWTANQNGLTAEERAAFARATKIMDSLP